VDLSAGRLATLHGKRAGVSCPVKVERRRQKQRAARRLTAGFESSGTLSGRRGARYRRGRRNGVPRAFFDGRSFWCISLIDRFDGSRIWVPCRKGLPGAPFACFRFDKRGHKVHNLRYIWVKASHFPLRLDDFLSCPPPLLTSVAFAVSHRRWNLVHFLDAIGYLDGTRCVLEWKTTSSRYPEEPAGLLALDPQLVCYSWITGISEVAQVVFVRRRLVEVLYLRTSITEEQRQEFGQLVSDTIERIERAQFLPHSGIRFPQNPCSSCPYIGLCLGRADLVESALVRRPGAERLDWLDELAC